MSFIGVFDSGIGGLSILNALQHKYPQEQFIYLADTANIPYGDKDIRKLSKIFLNNINYLKEAKGIVIACNTMSALINQLKLPNIPILGMIDNLIQTTTEDYPTLKSIGILATSFTVQQKTFVQNFHQYDSDINVVQIAAPKLVPAIEANSPEILKIADEYISQFPIKIEHIILGCTHYNLLLNNFQQQYPHLQFIHPYKKIISRLLDLPLEQNKNLTKKQTVFLTTKYSFYLQQNADKILNTQINWKEISI